MASLREALTGAYDKLESDSPPEETAPPDTTSGGESESAPEAEAKPSESSGAPETPEAKEAKPEDSGRNERGQFLPKEKTPSPKPTPVPQNGKPQGAVQKPAETVPQKAPKGWKPEVWAKASPEVQAAIQRREREVAVGMQEAAPMRQQMQRWQEVTAPFEAMVRSQGADMHQTVDNLLRTQYALMTAPPAGKAQIVANLISSFGVDPGHVASYLQGQAPQVQQQAQGLTQQQVAQQFDQLLSQRQSQQLEARAHSELEEFVASHEFFEELKPTMEKLMEGKVAYNFDDAYNQAAKLHPEISGILAQREAAKQAQAANASTQRARAASTLKSSPAGPTGKAQGKDLRSVLDRAYDTLASGRR